MSRHSGRIQRHKYNTRQNTKSQNEDTPDLSNEPNGLDHYLEIPLLKLSWKEECETADSQTSWHSNYMTFPFIADDGDFLANFPCLEDDRYFFQKKVSSLLTTQERVNEITGYINEYIDSLSDDYYQEIVDAVDSIQIAPESAFSVGDLCMYAKSSLDNKFVEVQSFNQSSKMYRCQALKYPVNNVIHLNQNATEHKLDIETNEEAPSGYKGAVPNDELILLLSSHDRQNMDESKAKAIALSIMYQTLYNEKTAKYEVTFHVYLFVSVVSLHTLHRMRRN